MEEFADEAGDIRTGAAGDAHCVSELVVRGLAQSCNATERSELLDVLDKLLEVRVYSIGEAIASFERNSSSLRRHQLGHSRVGASQMASCRHESCVLVGGMQRRVGVACARPLPNRNLARGSDQGRG